MIIEILLDENVSKHINNENIINQAITKSTIPRD